jgi:hypothetical protein
LDLRAAASSRARRPELDAGKEVTLGAAIDRERAPLDRPNLRRPVARAPETVTAVLDVFFGEGFAAAAPIGRFVAVARTSTSREREFDDSPSNSNRHALSPW